MNSDKFLCGKQKIWVNGNNILRLNKNKTGLTVDIAERIIWQRTVAPQIWVPSLRTGAGRNELPGTPPQVEAEAPAQNVNREEKGGETKNKA